MFLKSLAARKANIAIVLSGILVATPAVGQVVGKTAAVNQDSTVEGRTLEIGASVIHKERIKTNARGSVQLLFIDRTTLSLGPNSDLVINEYVFDPSKNTGKMTVALGKGAMRFIGGQITHISSATVTTPSASIGIRGGLVDINTNGKTTSVSNSFGVVTISSGGGTPASVPQGSTGTTGGGGAPTVAVTTQQQVNSNNQQFQSKGGQTGGAPPGTSAAAATGSSSNIGFTTSITPTTGPATGSTASGPSSGSGGPNWITTTFSGGLPTAVTQGGQSVHTSSGTSGATFSQPPSASPGSSGGGGKGGGGGPPPPCCH